MFDMVLITSLQWSCFLFTDGNYSCEMVLGDGGGGNGEYHIGDYTLNDCIKNFITKRDTDSPGINGLNRKTDAGLNDDTSCYCEDRYTTVSGTSYSTCNIEGYK